MSRPKVRYPTGEVRLLAGPDIGPVLAGFARLEPRRLVSVAECAQLLSCRTGTVRRLMEIGEIREVWIGPKMQRVDMESVEDFILRGGRRWWPGFNAGMGKTVGSKEQQGRFAAIVREKIRMQREVASDDPAAKETRRAWAIKALSDSAGETGGKIA